MSVSEHADDHRLDPPRGRSSRLTVLDQERADASAEQSNNHPTPVLSASLRRAPLLAVCGLCGGAGASTIAYLTALAEARSERGDVLLADTADRPPGSPTTPASSRHGR